MSIDRAAIAAAAMELVDTPYLHQGRLPGRALDCAGVLIVLARRFGIVKPDFDITGYTGAADGHTLQAYCEQQLVRVPDGAFGIGDALLLDWGRLPTHLAVLVPHYHGGLAVVHALGPGGVARVRCTPLNLPRMRIVAAYSFPGAA